MCYLITDEPIKYSSKLNQLFLQMKIYKEQGEIFDK